MNIETLTTIFGWMTLINSGLLLFFTIAMVAGKGFAAKTHQKLFEIPTTDLNKVYFRFLANYKLLIAIFNLTPYIALRIVGAQ